mmetsp:Transcript_56964/g.185106  ORF Transcript_56964/g.185106 Transcript_56964/m.185106 type:complete len:103 (+) Transcript_56964:1367-1675(+)
MHWPPDAACCAACLLGEAGKVPALARIWCWNLRKNTMQLGQNSVQCTSMCVRRPVVAPMPLPSASRHYVGRRGFHQHQQQGSRGGGGSSTGRPRLAVPEEAE